MLKLKAKNFCVKAGYDSPGRCFARPPSLQQVVKRVFDYWKKSKNPLSGSKERVDQRSVIGASPRQCHIQMTPCCQTPTRRKKNNKIFAPMPAEIYYPFR